MTRPFPTRLNTNGKIVIDEVHDKTGKPYFLSCGVAIATITTVG
jgi:hypothetical protein